MDQLIIVRQEGLIRDLERLSRTLIDENARLREENAQLRARLNKEESVEINIFDKVTRIPNCTVEILENTKTGQTSTGWYRGEAE